MSTAFTKALALAAFSVLIVGLARPALATHRCEDYGLKPVGLFVEGQPVEDFVSETRAKPGGVEDFLAELGLSLTQRELATQLLQINKDPIGPYDVPQALRGAAGFSTILLLQRLIFVDDLGFPADESGKPIAEKVLYGKIRDYIFIEGPENRGPGHLSVDTCTDDRMTGRRELYHWDIEVPDALFEVTRREEDRSQPPFPGLTLPQAALDPTNSHSIWARGLDHKLSAKGQGIEVKNVYYRVLSPRETPLQRLEDRRYYESTPESCIDLFTRGRPPATIGELVGNDYCLGRCAHPAIYNSGE